jgi:hypothetical protein
MNSKDEWIAFYITKDDYQSISERDKLSAAWDESLKPRNFLLSSVKCTRSSVERYTLREKSWWADITVSPDGFVNIQSDYGDYHYRWSSFGDDIKKFLIGCDYSYLYGKFGMTLPRIFNQGETIKRIRKDILESRKNNNLDAELCREAWTELGRIAVMEHTSSGEEWARVISDTCVNRIVYDYDLTNMPCVTEDNYQLKAFLTFIWPEFIKVLKSELGI